MKRKLFAIVMILLCIQGLFAQKVGLVMSGGGAKGVAHIGVIRALEENGIPIDYVAGTSMGAIVGAMYAMGYSPDEMMALINSEAFKSWQTGELTDKEIYFFNKQDDTPELFAFNFANKKTSDIVKNFFSGSIISPDQMNIAFLELFSQATAACKGDFNNLFVPFFCMASDVYNKKALQLDKGDLGDAVRASMSIPLIFKPIKIDSMLVYDGGIFNNYPVPEMKQTFKPDFILGSVVATDTPKPTNERDLMQQMEAIIMYPTDYSVPEKDGIQLRFDLSSVGVLDFYKGNATAQTGYDSTMAIINQIKERVSRRVSKEEIEARREEFKKRFPKLEFDSIEETGISNEYEMYLIRNIMDKKSDTFNMADFRQSYFRILSDRKVEEIVPHAIFNEQTGMFKLKADIRVKDRFQASFGGNLSSLTANQIYLGFVYDRLSKYNQVFKADAQIGNFYNNVQLSAQFFLRSRLPQYFKLTGNYSYYRYYDNNRLFYDYELPAFMNKTELFFKTDYGIGLGNHGRFEFGLGIGRLSDRYYQSQNADLRDGFDESTHNLLSAKLSYEYNTQVQRLFPTSGTNLKVMLQGFAGEEIYRPNHEATTGSRQSASENYTWPQLKISLDKYYNLSKKFTLGMQFEGVYAKKDLYSNFTASVLQAPAFTPTLHSRIMFNEAFRANQYVAAGVKPIVTLFDRMQIRTEFYAFSPVQKICRAGVLEGAYYSSDLFPVINYMGELSLVYQFPFLSISAFTSYYNYPSNNVYFGVNIGFLIFNKKFIE